MYSGLSHLSDLLFGGIVSYGGTLALVGSVMRDDRVTLAKGVARILCIKQLMKRKEGKTNRENILRWKPYQVETTSSPASREL